MRSNRADVRNPLAGLPSAAAFRRLPPGARTALRAMLLDLSKDARIRANHLWDRHKAPMATYWKSIAVNARHLAVLLRPAPAPRRARPAAALLLGDDLPFAGADEACGDRCYKCELPVGQCTCCDLCGAAPGGCDCEAKVAAEFAGEVPRG